MDPFAPIIQALIITLREGTEVALVLGIVLAYLRKTDRDQLRPAVYLGLGLAVAFSIAGAAIFYRLGLDAENELLEGITMLAAALLVGTLVIWMWSAGRGLKEKLEKKVDRLAAEPQEQARGWLRSGLSRAGLPILVFTFIMVLREGVETVLFLTALSVAVESNPLYNVLGGGLGIALAIVFGALLVRGSLRVNLRHFFLITGMVLLLLVLKLLAGAIHEFSEIGLLPTNRTELAIVGFFTREVTSGLILVALILFPGLALWWHSFGTGIQIPADLPAAKRRKLLAEERRAKRWGLATAITAVGLSILLATSLVASVRRGYDPEPQELKPTDGRVTVKAVELEEGKMHKYSVQIQDKQVRFFLLKQNGRVASALDVCEICPLKGYLQRGGVVICKSCNAPINFATIGQPGGCNPIPLSVKQEGGKLVVDLKDLVAAKKKF
ncbi:MAG: Fe-S-containing protein [Thermodesulfobacteriota bacterium]